MTIDEAIKHAEEVAEKNEKKASWFWGKGGNPNYENCVERAKEHRQLAKWLKELKDYKERTPSYEAGYNDAESEEYCMSKCVYDLSEDCHNKDRLACVLDKIEKEINSPNRGTCDYFIVDRIEEIIDKYKTESEE